MKALNNFRYHHQMRDQIRANLAQFPTHRQNREGLTAAAVTVTIVNHNSEAALLLTRRATSLRAHSGQWALPGGRIDSGESADGAALRELQEEVGLTLPPTSIVGLLDDYITRSGYCITPVVIWADTGAAGLKPNPSEVASIHSASFYDLARHDAPAFQPGPEPDREILSMRLSLDEIYAPTAAVLYQFREVALFGRATRVLAYDQPQFAWR